MGYSPAIIIICIYLYMNSNDCRRARPKLDILISTTTWLRKHVFPTSIKGVNFLIAKQENSFPHTKHTHWRTCRLSFWYQWSGRSWNSHFLRQKMMIIIIKVLTYFYLSNFDEPATWCWYKIASVVNKIIDIKKNVQPC